MVRSDRNGVIVISVSESMSLSTVPRAAPRVVVYTSSHSLVAALVGFTTAAGANPFKIEETLGMVDKTLNPKP